MNALAEHIVDTTGGADRLELVAAMSRDFASSLDIEATLERALQRITRQMDAVGGALFLIESDGTTLRCHASVGPTEITGLTLPSDKGIVGRCIQSDTAEIVRDVALDSAFHDAFDAKTGFSTRSILCAPMSVNEQRLGAIELVNKAGGDGLFAPTDLTVLEALAASAALALLNARMAAALVEQERVKRELELAAEIQRGLLPEARDDAFPVHGVNHPARMVSGDFFDFFELDDGRVCFCIGDVSGKGMNAALLMAKTASLYRCLGKTVHQPGRLLALVNAEICETATRGMFVTMIGGILDPRTGLARLANAGHEPALLLQADGTVTALPAEAPPLGIPAMLGGDGFFPEVEIALDGGALYLFTDGVTEGRTADGDHLGADGVESLIRAHAALPPGPRLDAVLAPLYRAGAILHDDLTMLVVEDSRHAARMVRLKGGSPTALLGNDETLLKLHFPARADRLKLVRSAVSEAAKLCGCNTYTALDIVIAVDEACQNVIRHAYGQDPNGEIDLEVRRTAEGIVLLLRDFAKPVDPDTIRPRELNDLRPGGLGTHFIREVMDEVEWLPPPADGGNLLKMVKRTDGRGS